MEIAIEKISGGFSVDGLALRNGKCGCTAVLPCCFSWSKIKRTGGSFLFTAKLSGPESQDIFTWGFIVTKGDAVVEVRVEDARDKTIFSGYYPPTLDEWVARGWNVAQKEGSREDFGLWRCSACKWLYKESEHKTAFDDLPGDWICPVCKAGKDVFERVG